MKLYLASFMEEKNFGPGRVISIDQGTKPYRIKVEKQFAPFTPSVEMINTYNKTRKEDQTKASASFISNYIEQLDSEVGKIKKLAENKGVSIQDLLPFKDGDTLASWPRAGRTSHRTLLVPYLEELGYEIVSN